MNDSHVGAFLDAVAASIQAALGSAVKSAVVWRGLPTEDVLQRLSLQTPAVVLACTRVTPAFAASPFGLDLSLAALAVADARDRGKLALAIVEALTRWLYAWEWGAPFRARQPESAVARNLATKAVDKQGLAIWVLAWTQHLELPDLDAGDPWIPSALLVEEGAAETQLHPAPRPGD